MRLLFLSNFYPPHDLGGMEQLCQDVAIRLQQRGHNVYVLTSMYKGDSQGSDTSNHISRTLYLQSDINYYEPATFFLKQSTQEENNARELRKSIEKSSPHLIVVWGMWNLSYNLPYWVEQWLPGCVAYYIASTWPMDLDIHRQYWQLPARHLWSELFKRPLRKLAISKLNQEGYPPRLRFKNAMCCSHYLREVLVQAGKLPGTAGIIYNGIDPTLFLRDSSVATLRPDSPLRLLYFGTLVSQKGVHTAIEAVGLLKQHGLAEHVELTILGKGHPDYEANLRVMVSQLDIQNQVHFAGRVPRDEIPSWLKRFQVFLFTSNGPEAMARTVMEAMAAGLLVIGTSAGGQAEMMVSGENCLTFRVNDAQALAAQIECVLHNPLLLSQLAQAGQRMILERFTLERMVDNIEIWLKSIIE